MMMMMMMKHYYYYYYYDVDYNYNNTHNITIPIFTLIFFDQTTFQKKNDCLLPSCITACPKCGHSAMLLATRWPPVMVFVTAMVTLCRETGWPLARVESGYHGDFLLEWHGCLGGLPTFSIKINQIKVNIPYMNATGIYRCFRFQVVMNHPGVDMNDLNGTENRIWSERETAQKTTLSIVFCIFR